MGVHFTYDQSQKDAAAFSHRHAELCIYVLRNLHVRQIGVTDRHLDNGLIAGLALTEVPSW
jgi:hypothetical protein